ncbi:hypothetical protein HK405_006167 [Cladochytrium tenue]|nr:hypothetical protein HK405_006167 [Cladochytrium tenue]
MPPTPQRQHTLPASSAALASSRSSFTTASPAPSPGPSVSSSTLPMSSTTLPTSPPAAVRQASASGTTTMASSMQSTPISRQQSAYLSSPLAYAEVPALISKETRAALDMFCDDPQGRISTPHTPLLAAFGVLLYRYSLRALSDQAATGKASFLVGVLLPPVEVGDGETQRMQCLPVNVEIRRRESFAALAERTEQKLQEAFARHQEALASNIGPGTQTVGTLDLGTPSILFGVRLDSSEDWSGFSRESKGGIPDCALACLIDLEALTVSSLSDSGVFRPQMVSRMMVHFRVVLEGALEDPLKTQIGRLTVLTPAEQTRQLVEWNRPANRRKISGPEPRSLYDAFEAAVGKYPHRPAILRSALGPGGKLATFLSIKVKASRLASYLSQQLGVRRGDSIVILHWPDSGAGDGDYAASVLNFLIASVAVLRLGCVVVPLSLADFPKEWIQVVQQKSSAGRVLVAGSWISEGFEVVEAQIRELFTDGSVVEGVGSESLEKKLEAAPSAPAISGGDARPQDVAYGR